MLFLGYNTYTDIITPDINMVDTLQIIDTVFVKQDPETLIVTKIETKWYKEYPDSNLIEILEDSLTNLHISYENFKKSLENDSIFSINSDTIFSTGDSLNTEVLLWMKNDSLHSIFNYLFHPAPDIILYAIPNGYIKKPFFSLAPYLNVKFNSIEMGALFFSRNNIILGINKECSFSDTDNNSLGIIFGRKFDFRKPNLNQIEYAQNI